MIRKIGLFKRVSVVLAALLVTTTISGCKIQYVEEETESTTVAQTTAAAPEETISLRLWYSDESLTSYILRCSREYEAANSNVNISISLIPESDYISTLTEKAIGGEAVDLYIVNNDNLEQMRLAGIAQENTMTDIYNSYNYSEKAINACTYKGHMVAYPLFFDTTFLLYNKDYVEDPDIHCFEDIKTFAEGYEVPAGSKLSNIFTCNLNDIFFNYAFLGRYLDMGGVCGDDKSITFEINEKVYAAVNQYKALIDYFFINRADVDYYSCINGFENGSIAFTIADTDMYERIRQSCDYVGVLPFLNMSDTIATAPLSITTCVAVNPFSKNAGVAASFAKYMTYTNASSIYDDTAKVACRKITYEDDNLNQIYASYEKSVPKLKIMYSDEFYALLEVAMHLMAEDADDIQALAAVGNYLRNNWN